MSDTRRIDVTAALVGATEQADGGAGLCVACCELLECAGAAISFGVGADRQSLCSCGPAVALGDLQFVLGQGPTIDAFGQPRPVVAYIVTDAAVSRWPAFTIAAQKAGVMAVVAYPLVIGAARLGVLTAFFEESPDAGRIADGGLVAAVLTDVVLGLQAQAAPGALAGGLADAGSGRAEVHQASGVLAVQLDIGITEALVRLRAHAYASGRQLEDVAVDVLSHRLYLDK